MAGKVKDRIYIDMDGVLCSFVQGVLGLFNHPDPKNGEGAIEGWDGLHHEINRHRPEFAHVTHDQVMDAMRDEGHQFWARLPIYPWAYGLIGTIDRSGADYYLLTTHAGGESAMGKVQWVRRFLPHLEDRMILTKQKWHCAGPGRVLIDDHHRNIDAWNNAGGHAILWPSPHNRARTERLPIDTIVERDVENCLEMLADSLGAA